jgi:hypothetical protein
MNYQHGYSNNWTPSSSNIVPQYYNSYSNQIPSSNSLNRNYESHFTATKPLNNVDSPSIINYSTNSSFQFQQLPQFANSSFSSSGYSSNASPFSTTSSPSFHASPDTAWYNNNQYQVQNVIVLFINFMFISFFN